MKKRIINIIMIFSIITVIFMPILSKADSGFDSDFGGGSDFGSSDWGSSSYDSDYSGSGSSGDSFIVLVIIAVIIIIIVTSSKKSSTNNIPDIITSNKKSSTNNILTFDEIKSLDPTLDVNKFYHDTFEIYKQVQYAWRDFDLDTIRNLVSDIRFENGIETIETITTVRTYDYLVDENKKVIRGNKNAYLEYTYKLTFTRYIDSNSITNCPSCGAPININSSGVCEYCKSTITNNETKFIMNKKQMLNQRRIK